MIDTSLWEQDIKSHASGTRTKFWLLEPGTESEFKTKYLFKIARKETGGHWAEYIASKIGKKLGFNTAEVELARYKSTIGTISKNFRVEKKKLYKNKDLFATRFENFNRYSLHNYELPYIFDILSAYNIEKEFIDIPVFDLLIANNDRHCDNWGVLNTPNEIKLAPLYDHGSSLGFNETDNKKSQMLKDNRMLHGFCNRGKSSIGLPNEKKPKHFKLLEYIEQRLPTDLEISLNKINSLNEDMIQHILNNISDNVMSSLNKDWIFKLLMYRKQWILEWYERRRS